MTEHLSYPAPVHARELPEIFTPTLANPRALAKPSLTTLNADDRTNPAPADHPRKPSRAETTAFWTEVEELKCLRCYGRAGTAVQKREEKENRMQFGIAGAGDEWGIWVDNFCMVDMFTGGLDQFRRIVLEGSTDEEDDERDRA